VLDNRPVSSPLLHPIASSLWLSDILQPRSFFSTQGKKAKATIKSIFTLGSANAKGLLRAMPGIPNGAGRKRKWKLLEGK